MADLQVNDHVLSDSERRLNRLHSEFSNLDDQKHELEGIWGSGDIAGAMGNFFDNWKHYRKQLLSNIEDVGNLVTETRQTFSKADSQLAKNVQQHGQSRGHH